MSLYDGLTVQKFFSSFYSTARRRFRLSAAQVDYYMDVRAYAEIHGHDLVFLSSPTVSSVTGTIGQHRFRIAPRGAAEWTNDFNRRVGTLQRHPATRG